jgi:hypothetical protein
MTQVEATNLLYLTRRTSDTEDILIQEKFLENYCGDASEKIYSNLNVESFFCNVNKMAVAGRKYLVFGLVKIINADPSSHAV